MKTELHDLHEPPIEGPEVELEDEEVMDLLIDCQLVIASATTARQPKWLMTELHRVLKQLNEAVTWQRIQ